MANANAHKSTFYGYGIVDRLNHPYWDEACVCEDRGPMEDVVTNLNDYADDDPRAPYRVVTLEYTEVIPKTKGGKSKKERDKGKNK